jgi:plasmid stabilization system protein ParE
MVFKHIFDPKAAEQYEEAYNWYNERSDIAGDKLIIEVEEAIKKICVNPFRYRNTYKNLRETSLRKYPYSIIYLTDVSKKTVVIVSIFHHRKNPKRKYK